jgi:predicted transcriptional regulator
MLDTTALVIAISSSLLSGLATGLLATWREHKKEVVRQSEREKDRLVLELKDLQITCYQIQKDLDDWRLKYYNTLEELIEVKAELEKTLIKLTNIEHEAN